MMNSFSFASYLVFHYSTIQMGVTELVFELQAIKESIKYVFSRSYCCYGNLLCHEIDTNMFTNDIGQFFDTMILASTDQG